MRSWYAYLENSGDGFVFHDVCSHPRNFSSTTELRKKHMYLAICYHWNGNSARVGTHVSSFGNGYTRLFRAEARRWCAILDCFFLSSLDLQSSLTSRTKRTWNIGERY